MKGQGSLPRRATTLLVVTILGAVAALAGCGGANAAAGSSKGCTSGPGVTAHHLSYGLLYTASGPNSSSLGAYRAGADARLGVANAAGGVFGRTVSYTWADDQGRADANLAAAQHLVNTQNLLGIQEFSLAPSGSARWLNQRGIPVVGTSNNAAWTENRNMFTYLNLMTSNAGSVTTWGRYERDQGAKSAAVLYSPLDDGSRQVSRGVADSLAHAGIKTVLIEAAPNGLDVGAVVQKIQASGADLLSGFIDPATFVSVALAARGVDPTIKILSAIGYDAQFLSVGKKLHGMSVFIGYQPFERPVPAHKLFLDAMARYAPQLQPAANELALSGWIDADLMLRGLQAAGKCPTRQAFMANLRAVHSYDAGGLLAAPVDLSTVYNHLTTCYWFVKIKEAGDGFQPDGTRPQCGERLQ